MKTMKGHLVKVLICLLLMIAFQGWACISAVSQESLEVSDMSLITQVLFDWLDEVFAWRVLP